MPFGYLFVALNPARIRLYGFVKSDDPTGSSKPDPVAFQFVLTPDTLKKVVDWAAQNSLASSGMNASRALGLTGTDKANSFAKHEQLVRAFSFGFFRVLLVSLLDTVSGTRTSTAEEQNRSPPGGIQ